MGTKLGVTVSADDPAPRRTWLRCYRGPQKRTHKPISPHYKYQNTSASDFFLPQKFNSTEEGVRALFEEANFFFTDLGLEDMSMSYGEDAVIVRPEDRDVGMYINDDFFILNIRQVSRSQLFIQIRSHQLVYFQYAMPQLGTFVIVKILGIFWSSFPYRDVN